MFFIEPLPYKLGQIGGVVKFICPGQGNITSAIFIDNMGAAVSSSIHKEGAKLNQLNSQKPGLLNNTFANAHETPAAWNAAATQTKPTFVG
ncbi:MAG TPA: hypothetical protein DDW76_04940 [Cyanobacteria bacterium UBA11369]|nr:hypothetical protein [Cyanobacteria bacterium UBA11371]HBE30845.1 hypothetical protein [Cyanobacteria bacterium UBA11368]HBE48153.1 hypothetical protein [Cyanobacteria bacterium UBA11369]